MAAERPDGGAPPPPVLPASQAMDGEAQAPARCPGSHSGSGPVARELTFLTYARVTICQPRAEKHWVKPSHDSVPLSVPGWDMGTRTKSGLGWSREVRDGMVLFRD